MKLAVVLIAIALVVGGGAVAVAATGVLSPKQEQQAFLDDAAKELGVEPSELSAALKSALEKRVDAAVAAGELTKSEAERIKARIDAGDAPLFFGPRFGHEGRFGPGPGRHHRPGGKLGAAASYLGMSETALREALAGGKTLAQIAKDRGKSVDGLVQAMVAAKTKLLDEAVEAGRLTDAERDEIVAGLKARVTDLVNGRFPPRHRHEFRERRGDRILLPTA
jgi:hypothetical protein